MLDRQHCVIYENKCMVLALYVCAVSCCDGDKVPQYNSVQQRHQRRVKGGVYLLYLHSFAFKYRYILYLWIDPEPGCQLPSTYQALLASCCSMLQLADGACLTVPYGI
jgi:hypothetical protein